MNFCLDIFQTGAVDELARTRAVFGTFFFFLLTVLAKSGQIVKKLRLLIQRLGILDCILLFI